MVDETPKRVRRPPWELVLRDMVSVDLTIKRWRGKAQLDVVDAFGFIDAEINPDDPEIKSFLDSVRATISGGKQGLLPPDLQRKLERIERQARDALYDLSFNTNTLFGHLMPKDNYAQFVKALTETRYDPGHPEYGSLRTHYYALRDELVANRDELVKYLRRAYTPLAHVAWRLSQGLAITDAEVAPTQVVEDYLERVTSALPSGQRIYSSFLFDWTVAEIPVPDEAVKQIKLDELEQQKQQIDYQVQELAAARERINSRAERDAALEVARAQYQAEREEADERYLKAQKERDRIERDIKLQREMADKARERIERDISPALEEITSRVRTMLYETTINALAAVEKHKHVPPQTAGALKKLIEQAENLNWTDDQQIDLYLAQLREISKEKTGLKDGEEAKTALYKLGLSLRADLLDLGAEPRSGREVGIPDNPLPELDRLEGRLWQTELPLDETPVQFSGRQGREWAAR